MTEWTEKYGCYRAEIAGMTLAVSWRCTPHNAAETDRGYLVSFGPWRLKKLFTDVEDAQRAACKLARKKLLEALDDLDVLDGVPNDEEG